MPKTKPQFTVNPPPREAVYAYVDVVGEPIEPVPGREYEVIGTSLTVRRGIPWITYTITD